MLNINVHKRTFIRSTPSASAPENSASSGARCVPAFSLISCIFPRMSSSSSSSSLSSCMAFPFDFLRAFLRLVPSTPESRNAVNPTVPVVFSGPRVEKSSWAERRFDALAGVSGAALDMTPTFWSWPGKELARGRSNRTK